jgi:uncharacterized protein YceK
MNKRGVTLVICGVLMLAGCGTEITAPEAGDAAPRKTVSANSLGGETSPGGPSPTPQYGESPTMVGSGT